MPINFPNSPSLNEIYSYDNKTWEWNGTYWEVYSALTSYITSAYTVGNGYSDISGVTGGNIVLKSFSGVGLTITDSGDKLTFISSGSYLPTSGGTVTGNTIYTSGLTATTLTVQSGTTIGSSSFGLGLVTSFDGTYINLTRQGVTTFIGSGSAGNAGIGTLSNVAFTLFTNNSAKAQITAGGNFLIGTTTDSGFKLDVNGTSAFRGIVRIFSEQQLRQEGITQTFTSALGIFRFSAWSNGGLTAYLNAWNYEGYLNFAVNIGTSSTAVASAVLELTSTTRGFLPPRMTTTQKNAIASPATGLTVYDNTINEMQTYNGSAWITKRNGVEVYQAPLFINTHIAATGNTNTVLYGSPYPLTTSTNGNIIKINAIFQAKQTSVNTFIRVYASTSPTTLSGGAVQLGNFALTAANAAAGLDTIGYDKTFILTNESGSYQIITVNSFGTNTDTSPESLITATIGSGVISYPYICITLNQGAVLHSVTINYSR